MDLNGTQRDMTPPQLARSIGAKPAKVNHWINTGQIEAYDSREEVGSGKPRWRITPEAWETFKRRRSNKPAPTPAPRRRNITKPTREWV